jgi:hypothetical protein
MLALRVLYLGRLPSVGRRKEGKEDKREEKRRQSRARRREEGGKPGHMGEGF